jgi:transposase
VVEAFSRRRSSHKPFPDHLPRERVVVPAPVICPCCGSDKLCKLGETITETLESIPRQWKVIQTVVKVQAIFPSMGRQNSSPPMIMFPSGAAPGSGRDQP